MGVIANIDIGIRALTSGFEKGIDRVRAGIGQLRSAVDGLAQAGAKLESVGSKITSMGVRIGAAGAALGAPLVAGARLFAGYEQQMARVKALTNASAGDFAKLDALALQLGRDTVFTAADAAEAMGNFARAGLSVNEILKATGPTLDLAAAGQLNMAESAQIVSGIVRGMGLPVEDLTHAIDVLTVASTQSGTNLTELGYAFKYIGPLARLAKIPFEEITAAIQALSRAGMPSEMAGTTLRGAILALTDTSVEAQAELRELGISARDAAGNFLPLPDIVAQFERSLAHMGPTEQLQAIGKIFDKRQASGFASLIATGSEELRRMGDALYTVDGRARKMAETLLDTVYGAWKILESSIENVGILAGRALMPTLRETMAVLVDLTNQTSDWVEKNGETLVAVAKWAAGLALAGAALTALGTAVSFAGMVITGFTGIVGVFTGALAFVFSPAGLVAAGAVALGYLALRSQRAMDILGGLAASVYALGYGVYRLVQWIGEVLPEGSNSLSRFGSTFEEVAGTVKTAWAGVIDAVKTGNLELAIDVAAAGMELALARMGHRLERYYELQLSHARNYMNGMAHFFSLGNTTMNSGGPLFNAANQRARDLRERDLERALNRLTTQAAGERIAIEAWDNLVETVGTVNSFMDLLAGRGGGFGGGRGGPRPPGIPDLTFDDKEKKKRERAVKAYDPPDAVERGTQAAVSIINQSRNREQELQERILVAEERGVRYLEEMRDALRRIPIIGAANF